MFSRLASAALTGGCLLAGALAGTQPSPSGTTLSCREGSTLMKRVELLLARPKERGGPSSEAQLEAFIAQEVTPRFPDGLTQWDATGQWRTTPDNIRSIPSRVIVIWYADSPDADRRIEEIRRAYFDAQHREIVMRVDGEECVSF